MLSKTHNKTLFMKQGMGKTLGRLNYIFLVIILLLWDVSLGYSKMPLTKVSLQLQWKHQFEFAGFYAAIDKGFYQEAGLQVELREYESGKDIFETVLSGESDFGIAYSSVISARMQGKPVVLLANYFKRSPLAIAARTDIYSPSDLKGKKIMGEKHEIESANFTQMFRQFNITPADFSLIKHTFTAEKFISGEVDAMTVFLTNEVYNLRQQKIPFNIIDPNNYGVPFYDVILFSSEKLIRQKEAMARAFTLASNRGWQYALDHREEIIDLILKQYNTQNKTREHLFFEADETRRVMLPDIHPIGSIDPQRIRKIEELFVSQGVADNLVEPQDFIFDLNRSAALHLTPGEKIFIQKHPKIKVIRSFDQPPFSVMQDGIQSGYLYDLLAKVLNIAGLQAEYVEHFLTYDSMIEALENGTVDLLPNTNSTRILPKHIKRTKPVITTPHTLIGKLGTSDISHTSELFGRKVAVVKGFAQDEHLNKFPEIIKVLVDNNEEGFAAIRNDQAEYFLNNFANAAYVLQKMFANDLHIAGTLPYTDFPPLQLSFGVNGTHPELPKILNKALDSVPLDELQRISDKWLIKKLASSEKHIKINLTKQERAFISRHPIIRASNEQDWPPFDFVENGMPKGFSIDYLNLAAAKAGIAIQYINGFTWDELLDMSRRRELDLMQSIVRTPDRMEYLDFTEAYMKNPSTIFVKEGTFGIKNIKDLQGKKVALVKGFFQQEYIEKTYPNIELSLFPSRLKALEAVSLGEVDAVINRQIVADWLLRRNLISNVSGVATTGDPRMDNADLHFAVRKDWPELRSILQKGMEAISQEELNLLLLKWSPAPNSKRITLSEKEQEWLLAHPAIRVANETDWPPFDFMKNKTATGYSIDLMNLIAEKIGVKVNYINGYSWDTLYQMGVDGKMDVFPCIWKTEEREKLFFFTAPYMNTPYILTVQNSENSIQSIDDMNGRIIAGVKGYASMGIIKKHYPNIKAIEVNTPLDGLKLVSYGKADAYLDSIGSVSYHSKSNLITNLKVAAETTLGGRLQASQLHFAVKKDYPELFSMIQKAINSITPEQILALQQKWLDITREHGEPEPALQLTKEEQLFQNSHPLLKIAYNIDWPPIEFTDEEAGMFGISAEFIKKMNEVLKIKFEPAPPQSWQEMLQAVKDGKLDFLSAITPTKQMSQWFDFTDSYFTIPMVIVTRDNVPYISSLSDLNGKNVAVVNNYASHEFLKTNHPQIHLLMTDNIKEGLLAVSQKKAFAFVGSFAAINHIMGREGISGLKVSGNTPYQYEIAMAVKKGNKHLLAILNKAMAAISKQDKEAIFSKWISSSPELKIDYSLVWKIIALSFIILVGIIVWNRRLHAMAKELSQANKRLYNEISERKKIELALRASEESIRKYAEIKTTLLREVNHRVKNNLTAIISMLHKEEDRAFEEGKEEYMSRLQEIVGRVMGLLTVHSMLSSSEWKPLPLSQLSEAVIQETVKSASIDKSVTLKIEPSEISLDSDQSHNLAIVLNELATNSIKYALSEQGSTQIKMDFHLQNDLICIIFHDDGPGYPESVLLGNIPKRSIGFQLIQGIVSKNLQGNIELYNDHGAIAKISFPAKALDKENSGGSDA